MAPLSFTFVFLTTLITSFIPLANCHQNAFPDPRQPHHPDYDKRQLNLCPVLCGQGWCCLTGQNCKPISDSKPNSNPFECDDPLLQTTWEAYQGGFVSSVVDDASRLISSLASVYSTTFDLTTTPTTAASTSTTSTDQGSGPITVGSGPTKTESATATSTNAAARRVGFWNKMERCGWLLGVLGILLAA
ncbi:hypothetical protein V8F20_001467 [Naviculisporaceae sp. PSN 640]